MPISIDHDAGTIQFVAGTDDDQAGLRFRVQGDVEDRTVLLVDGSVLTGNGTDAPTADFQTAAAASAVAADASAIAAAASAVTAGDAAVSATASETAVSDLIAAAAALHPDASTAVTLNATFNHTEAEAALNSLGTKLNALITALGGT